MLQQVFLQAHRHLESGAELVNPRAWLMIAVKHRVFNLQRARRETPAAEIEPGRAYAAPTEEAEELTAVRSVLWTLPEKQHHAFVLRYWSGLSQSEIAQVLGTTASAVESLLVRARTTLISERANGSDECEHVRLRLVEGGQLSDRNHDHLKKCSRCRAGHLRLSRVAEFASVVALAPQLHVAHGLAAAVPGFSAPAATLSAVCAPAAAGASTTRRRQPRPQPAPRLPPLRSAPPARWRWPSRWRLRWRQPPLRRLRCLRFTQRSTGCSSPITSRPRPPQRSAGLPPRGRAPGCWGGSRALRAPRPSPSRRLPGEWTPRGRRQRGRGRFAPREGRWPRQRQDKGTGNGNANGHGNGKAKGKGNGNANGQGNGKAKGAANGNRPRALRTARPRARERQGQANGKATARPRARRRGPQRARARRDRSLPRARRRARPRATQPVRPDGNGNGNAAGNGNGNAAGNGNGNAAGNGNGNGNGKAKSTS